MSVAAPTPRPHLLALAIACAGIATPLLAADEQAAPQARLNLPQTDVNATRIADGSAEAGYLTDSLKNVGALGGMALKDTPYSISVVSSELIRNTQATSTDDIFKLSPFTQFTSPSGAGYASSVAIRGFNVLGNLNIA